MGANQMIKFDPQRDKITRFDSPEEFLAYCKALPYDYHADYNRFGSNYSHNWGGDKFTEVLPMLEHGDMRNVKAAQRIIDQMQENEIFTTGVKLITPSIIGFIPNVPGAIMGHPRSMLNRIESDLESVQTPIVIYYDVSVSAGVRDREILNRGVAAMALVMALNAFRPVELYCVSCWNARNDNQSGHGVAVRVETKPLDLARAAFMMTAKEFTRRICFSAAFHQADRKAFPHSFPWAWGVGLDDNYIRNMREAYNMNEQDIFLKGGYLFDRLMLDNPIQWVKQMIEKHTQRG